MGEQLPADEGAAEVEEGVVEFRAALVAHQQAAVAVQPGEAALGYPTVPAELGAGLDPAARDPRGDVAAAQHAAAAAGVVALVGVQLRRAPARAPRRSVR